MTGEQDAAPGGQDAPWRDSYLYGKADGQRGQYEPRGGNTEAYELGHRWGADHPLPAVAL